jgi:outer membrane protein OmpA-like peptidoglycan-associated protein
MFNKRPDDSNWLSIADMMTALMVIFMFIAINFIIQIIEHTFIQEEIYKKFESDFSEEIDNGEIELSPDGAIRFNIDKGKKLFEIGHPELTSTFKNLLIDFLPKYWAILNSDSTYLDYIKEIRIEGHADSIPYYKKSDREKTPEVSYLNNLELSQNRAKSVLQYLREQPIYQNAETNEKARMDFLFTSIGFSYARSLNEEGNYVYLDSNQVTNNQMSRRVEFRIVTSNKKLAEKLLKENGD